MHKNMLISQKLWEGYIHADSPVTEPCSDDENKNESDDVIAPESDANSKSLVQHDYDWYTTLVQHPLFRTKHPL